MLSKHMFGNASMMGTGSQNRAGGGGPLSGRARGVCQYCLFQIMQLANVSSFNMLLTSPSKGTLGLVFDSAADSEN